MVTALYRRYRPENFAELIGQSQVTDPLRTALRTNRVNHAYLFSGPRGCGKTTSARILARCLNCAEGPTDTPCGVCPSCLELARGGSGSLDVIEIDAASHNGVDDARDLRDRAVFAPARDRYKIFILDEAHMVTPQGFNALLKLVEEPPEHVKFIFATTEPEKVIGTIRSRTHHYPFRLVPPAVMLEYVEQLCQQESVTVAPGVLPLVVRAGGGSVRDTLSLLDQLIAGSEDGSIRYERAVALLGYTDAALLDDVVDALAVADPASAFAAIDRVVQTGQDPRRFVEDLLERLRDLIVVAATNESAAAVLRGISPEELDTMSRQAGVFGPVGLSRAADIANRALTDMTGATSPRLHLELMTARMLVPEADDTQRGALARVERLERRVGVGDAGGHQAPVAVMPPAGSRPAPGGNGSHDARPVASATQPTEARQQRAEPSRNAAPSPGTAQSVASATPADAGQSQASAGGTPARTDAPAGASTAPAGGDEAAGAVAGSADADPSAVVRDAAASWAAVAPETAPGDVAPRQATPDGSGVRDAPRPVTEPVSPSSTGQGTSIGAEPAVEVIGAVGFQQMRDAWPQIVEHVQHAKRSAWSVVVTAQVTALRDDVLTLTFPSQQDVVSFKEMSDPSTSVSELLRAAIVDVLGLRVKFVARGPAGGGQQRPAQPAAAQPATERSSATQQATAQAAATQAAASQASSPQPSPDRSTSGEQTDALTGPSVQTRQQTPGRAQEGAPAPTAVSTPAPAPAPSAPAEAAAATTSSSAEAPARTTSPTAAPTGSPVTEWAVATIPASDPAADAVPEDVEPAWAAPFGSAPAGAATAPAERTGDRQQPAATAAVGRPSEPATGTPAAAPSAAVAPPVPAGATPDVPVDDYPLDDDPYDDAAPFPDPGHGRGSRPPAGGAGARPSTTARPTTARPTTAPAAGAGPVGAGPTGAAAPTRSTPSPSTPGPQVHRAAVAGRYGEAVVREILGAQFIEETSLHEEGA
ncbi:DNA polymerase III subunit gamma and tau [Curtobacterium sp. ISL-83]|uniref:DNA polymerase III subunit gamma and tau n=1 Tax=Curtobacterium sp. ISL-83 TaxID=2819145 RepID=UPI001BEA500F|nr:DNA polymerase III subunit gamma and tau [Curtobacterium sp. ISL-83]MBT2502937.1 DNA polymerase III subunit gamma and tau [Curtobacterium sp. ISL-83]